MTAPALPPRSSELKPTQESARAFRIALSGMVETLRKRVAGISLAEVAERSGLDPERVRKVKTAEVDLMGWEVMRLARGLGVKPSRLAAMIEALWLQFEDEWRADA